METVNKDSFKLEDFLDKERVIHCKSLEELLEIRMALYGIIASNSIERLDLGWNNYGSEVCFRFTETYLWEDGDYIKEVYCANREYYLDDEYEIVEWGG